MLGDSILGSRSALNAPEGWRENQMHGNSARRRTFLFTEPLHRITWCLEVQSVQLFWHGIRGEPQGKRRHRWAAQVRLGGCQQQLQRAESHRIKPWDQTLFCKAKHIGSSELAPSDGKMSLEALQPSLLRRATDSPCCKPGTLGSSSSYSLGKDASGPLLSQPSLSVPSISQKKFLHS